MNEPAHDAIAELLGAYALDAVDPEEARAVEDHLAECPRCRGEVARHREVAAALAFIGASAPEGLWGRIAARLETTPAEAEPELARLYPLRPPSKSVSVRVAALVGAAAAALILGLGLEVNRQRHDLSALKRQGGVQSALTEPGAAKVHLQSPDHRVFIDAVLTRGGSGYLVTNNLPRLAASRTYQLWGVIDGNKISLGVLGSHPTLVAFRETAPVQALAVTDEPSGGEIASTQAAVVVGTVDPAFGPNAPGAAGS